MKILSPIYLVLLLAFQGFSCNNCNKPEAGNFVSNQEEHGKDTILLADSSQIKEDLILDSINKLRGLDSSIWLNSFRDFRNVIFKGDKRAAKQFINFPIRSVNNDIWYLVYLKEDNKRNQIPEKIVPFNENDFDKYFSRLFSKRFVKAILKIKSEELYKKGHYQTVEFREANITYNMTGIFNKSERTLTLNLNSNTEYTDEYGEALDGGEFSILYEFEITNNSELKFKQVRVAG